MMFAVITDEGRVNRIRLRITATHRNSTQVQINNSKTSPVPRQIMSPDT